MKFLHATLPDQRPPEGGAAGPRHHLLSSAPPASPPRPDPENCLATNLPQKAVFLSYASRDAEATRRLCDALRAAGLAAPLHWVFEPVHGDPRWKPFLLKWGLED